MIRKNFLIYVFGILFIVLPGDLDAGQLRQITLNDGSVIMGEVLSYVNGQYRIKTETIGEVTINDSNVAEISALKTGHSTNKTDEGNTETGNYSNQLNSIQNQLLSNDNIIDIIMSLKDDPQMQEILKDPEIAEALSSGNVTALLSNQKILALLNNPKIREINKKIGTK
ncbi:MAG: hypothetical protein L3V56_11760 [Candidatus Magnetoovum sp. WYHC-5]|nr:hypothetical protein [Candidatus Magnetoovum sp. WYHC-5]